MRKRASISRKKSKRQFRNTADKVHPKNLRGTGVQARGGYRL